MGPAPSFTVPASTSAQLMQSRCPQGGHGARLYWFYVSGAVNGSSCQDFNGLLPGKLYTVIVWCFDGCVLRPSACAWQRPPRPPNQGGNGQRGAPASEQRGCSRKCLHTGAQMPEPNRSEQIRGISRLKPAPRQSVAASGHGCGAARVPRQSRRQAAHGRRRAAPRRG
jgi:hypothetical protein